jgi:hypothetical protein
MECTLIVQGNAYESGNKSSLWMTPGLHVENYFDPELVMGALKIIGPCEHSLTVEAKDQLAKFLLSQGCTIRTLETVDD